MINIPESKWFLIVNISFYIIDEALLIQAQIIGLPQPRNCALDAFRAFLSGHERVQGHILSGSAKHMLDDEKDLVSLKTPGDRALLAQFLRNHWPSKVRNSSQQPANCQRPTNFNCLISGPKCRAVRLFF